MSRNLGHQLPESLLESLSRGELYRSGELGLSLLTVDEQGWPHVAMAPGAVALEPTTLWVALGGKSSSLQNAAREGKVTLLIAAPHMLYYVKGRAEVARPALQIMPQEAALKVTVTEVLQDVESFAEITGGISYRYRLMHQDFQVVIGGVLDELTTLATEDI